MWSILKALNWSGGLTGLIFFMSMLIAPWIKYDREWKDVQEVWDRWQTFNAAMLAFLASVIALNISVYIEKKQRQRRFIAAKSFLPPALSELTSYCKASAKVFKEIWERLESLNPQTRTALSCGLPEEAQTYKEIFSKSIAEAEPDVASYLAEIIIKLQIHTARLEEIYKSFSPDGELLIFKDNVISYMYSLSELNAMINRLYPFARAQESFSGEKLDWEDFRISYVNLDIWLVDVEGLEGFTKRAITRS